MKLKNRFINPIIRVILLFLLFFRTDTGDDSL